VLYKEVFLKVLAVLLVVRPLRLFLLLHLLLLLLLLLALDLVQVLLYQGQHLHQKFLQHVPGMLQNRQRQMLNSDQRFHYLPPLR
jgi:hypothetical protein